jgi:lysophospholipase L1-like esterase
MEMSTHRCHPTFAFACTLVLAMGWQVCFSQATYDSLTNVPEHYEKQTKSFQAQKARKGRPIIFLGNSITEGGDWKTLLKDTTVLNRGISGDVTYGVLQRLDEVVRHHPSKVFLLIGVNDLSRNVPNSVIIQNILNIVSRIHNESPKTQVFVQSILPVNPGHKNFPERFNKPSDITEINGQLKKYHEALRYTYVDLYSHFLDDRLLLDLRYTSDGLHLNQAGYVHWVSYLKKQKCL